MYLKFQLDSLKYQLTGTSFAILPLLTFVLLTFIYDVYDLPLCLLSLYDDLIIIYYKFVCFLFKIGNSYMAPCCSSCQIDLIFFPSVNV